MLTPNAKNAMLDHLATLAVFRSLHSAFPGNTGASELAGGAPAYARKGVTWNAASGGNLDDSNAPIFDVPAGATVRWHGWWSALTLGTFYGYAPNGAAPKEYSVDPVTDVFTAPAHGYADTQAIVFYGGAVPGGLVEGTVYFVRDSTANTFKVAATSGGVAIDITSVGDGTVVVSAITPETFGAQGTFTGSDADLHLNF